MRSCLSESCLTEAPSVMTIKRFVLLNLSSLEIFRKNLSCVCAVILSYYVEIWDWDEDHILEDELYLILLLNVDVVLVNFCF